MTRQWRRLNKWRWTNLHKQNEIGFQWRLSDKQANPQTIDIVISRKPCPPPNMKPGLVFHLPAGMSAPRGVKSKCVSRIFSNQRTQWMRPCSATPHDGDTNILRYDIARVRNKNAEILAKSNAKSDAIKYAMGKASGNDGKSVYILVTPHDLGCHSCRFCLVSRCALMFDVMFQSIMHMCIIECFRGRHRGGRNFIHFCSIRDSFLMQQNEPFLP